MNRERVSRIIENAKEYDKSDEEIWDYLSASGKSTFIESAKEYGKSDQEIRQHLGLSKKIKMPLKPKETDQKQPYTDPSQPFLQPELVTGKLPSPKQLQASLKPRVKPSVFEKVKEEAKTFLPPMARPATTQPFMSGFAQPSIVSPAPKMTPLTESMYSTEDLARNAILREVVGDFPILREAFQELPYRGMSEEDLRGLEARHIARTSPGHMMMAPARGMYEVGREFTEFPISALFKAKNFDELFARTKLGKIKISIPGKKFGLNKDFEIPASMIPAFGSRLLASGLFWGLFNKATTDKSFTDRIFGDKAERVMAEAQKAYASGNPEAAIDFALKYPSAIPATLRWVQANFPDQYDQVLQELHVVDVLQAVSGIQTGFTGQMQPGQLFPITGQQIGTGIQPFDPGQITGLPISGQLIPGAVSGPISGDWATQFDQFELPKETPDLMPQDLKRAPLDIKSPGETSTFWTRELSKILGPKISLPRGFRDLSFEDQSRIGMEFKDDVSKRDVSLDQAVTKAEYEIVKIKEPFKWGKEPLDIGPVDIEPKWWEEESTEFKPVKALPTKERLKLPIKVQPSEQRPIKGLITGEKGSIRLPNLGKATQQVHKFLTFRHKYSPVAERADVFFNEKKALGYHITESRKEIEKAIPDINVRRSSYVHLAKGGTPRNQVEQSFMDWFKEWGKRGVASGSFKKERADYVPFMFGNPYDEIKAALRQLPEKDARFIAIDQRFSKWSGHFQPRKSPDYDAYLNGIKEINKKLKRWKLPSEPLIQLYPETDMAKVLDRYGRSSAQKIVNHELINWIEGHHNVNTGKPLLYKSAYAIGDKDYSKLPEKINLKIDWVKRKTDDGFQEIPIRYFVHKSVKDALKNYLETDLWDDSKLAQQILAVKYIIRSVKLFNPIVINTKMLQRLIATPGAGFKPFLNIATLKVPWHQGKQMIKDHAIVKDAIEHGVQFWEHRPDDPRGVPGKEKWWQTEEEKEAINNFFNKFLNKIDNTWIRRKNDKIVTGVINATRFQMYKYLSDQFIKSKISGLKHQTFSVDEAKRMAAKMSNDLTYAALRQEMGRDYRVLGKLVFMSRNLIHGQTAIAKRLVGFAGKGDAIFTEDQLTAMSTEERKRLAKVLFLFGALPMLWNKKVTGKWINTEEGKRGYMALWKDDQGRVTYIKTLDYVQDFVNIFAGQSKKLIGKIGFVPKQALEQFVNKNLFTDKPIVSPSAGMAKEWLVQRPLYMTREFTPGMGNVMGIEDIASLGKTIANKGWSKTFKDFSGAQYGDFLIKWVGLFPSHGWPGLEYVTDALDKAETARKEKKGKLRRYLKAGDREGAAEFLAEGGATESEILKQLENSGKLPITIMFKFLPSESKIETFYKIKKDKSVWNTLSSEVKNNLSEQKEKAEDAIEKRLRKVK